MMKSVLFVLLLASVLAYVGCASPYTTTLETELRSQLFTNYEVLQRPSQTVNVKMSFTLITLNYLDIKSQTLSTSGYFGMEWSDTRLKWNDTTTYENIMFIFSEETYTWRPAVVVENRLGPMIDLIGAPIPPTIILDSYSLLKRIHGDQRLSWKTVLFIWRHYDQIWTIEKSAIDLCDTSLNPQEKYLSNDVSYMENDWVDSRLKWDDNSSYRNVKFLFSTEEYTWRPAVVIENSASDLVVFSDTNTLIRIISTGKAYWTPGGVFQTHCEADITYYPLDTQDCYIALSTWAYTSGEVFLELADEPIILDDFKQNGEWEIIESSTTSETKTREGGSNSYSRLQFNFKLRRRPLFHILNTLFPVMLMSCLIICVFKLPPESGERVGLSLTVLLAYTVYLTLISDNIPQTSLSASILSTYLTIILMLSALSVIFTVIVLDIYFNHEDDEDIPSWLQSFTRVVLVRISFWKGRGCCSSNKAKRDDNAVEDISYPVKPPKDVKEGFAHIDEEKQEEDDDKDVKIYSWKEIALILDKCFMYLFIFMVITVTTVCLSIMASNY